MHAVALHEGYPMNFVEHAVQLVCEAVETISAAEVADVYALSFFISDLDDDPRYPILQLGYNTETQARAASHGYQGHSVGAVPAEVKWNYAFWLQNSVALTGETGTESRELLEQELVKAGLMYSDEDEESDFDACTPLAEAITADFVSKCITIAQGVHRSGVIARKFGRPVPIIIHELEYYDEIAVQTAAGNPPGLSHEFTEWVMGMYADGKSDNPQGVS